MKYYHIRTRIDLFFIPKVSRFCKRYKFEILKTARLAILMEFRFVWVGVGLHFFTSADIQICNTRIIYLQHEDHIWPLIQVGSSSVSIESASNMALRSMIYCTECQLKYFNLSKWKQISEWLSTFYCCSKSWKYNSFRNTGNWDRVWIR